MSSELEILDQLLGGDQSLALVRPLFETEDRFVRSTMAMLDAKEVRLLDNDGAEVPRWRWRGVLTAAAERGDFRLAITQLGAGRIG